MRGIAGVAAVAVALAAVAAAQPTPPPTPAIFPDGPGRDTFLRVCSGCHAPAIVAQQRLTPEGWASVVEQMAGNGAQGTDADFAAIKAYLAASFPAKPPAQP